MTGSLSIVADDQILFADKIFSKFGYVNLVDGRSIDTGKVKDADILLVRSVTRVNKSLLKNSKVKFVGSATSGIDHIDTDYLRESNIFFSYAPGSNARSVAEYVLNSLIETTRNTTSHSSFPDIKVGIIGYGHVGSKVKDFMDIFGVQYTLNDPPLYDKTKDKSLLDLEQVLQSDVITLHVPLTKEGAYPTYNLVDEKFLERLKPNVIFINTSRGEVIDEQALLSFKKRNPESTLILDVWCNEPVINTDLLHKAFIGTPHIAGYSHEAKIKATEILFHSLNDTLKTNFEYPELVNCKSMTLVPEKNNSDYLIEFIISQHWDILEDNILLQHYSNLTSEERPLFYDSLRKNYKIRHEYTDRVIDMCKYSGFNTFGDEIEKKLKKLGFKFKSI